VKLFEHKEFEQAILRAEEHFRARGLRVFFTPTVRPPARREAAIKEAPADWINYFRRCR